MFYFYAFFLVHCSEYGTQGASDTHHGQYVEEQEKETKEEGQEEGGAARETIAAARGARGEFADH
jgi:hypothetical protein